MLVEQGSEGYSHRFDGLSLPILLVLMFRKLLLIVIEMLS